MTNEFTTIPVLPLRESVIFPGVTTPIGAGRPGTLKAIQKAVGEKEREIFVVCQRENRDKPSTDMLYTVGTVARIGQVQRSRGKSVQVVLEGRRRAVATRFGGVDGSLEAEIRPLEETVPEDPTDSAFQALQRELRDRAAVLGESSGLPQAVMDRFLASVDDPSRLADFVTAHLDLGAHEKQVLLEILVVDDRLRQVLVQVERQISLLAAQQEIKDSVQRELGDRQREMVLREQLKAIRKELGEGDDGDDIDDLRESLEVLDLPEKARQEADRGLQRLGRINRESMEYQVIRTHLETIAELPWDQRSDDHLDLDEAAKVLEEDHYGLQDVKDRVLEFLAVHKLRQALQEPTEDEGDPQAEEDSGAEGAGEDIHAREDAPRGSILLFVGPPGVGKTSIAKSIARAMGRKYVRISLGGVRDEADIRGHRRTYVGAMPGRILQGMKDAGTKNPVFLLDEVDKLGVSFQGDPSAALLEVLDPAQNDTFVDHYLGVPFDLSEVLFIATANFGQNIPGPLMDRMELVEFTGYTESEKLEIARRFLLPRQRRQKALAQEQLEIADEAICEVISRYTREAGVRQLERELGKVARKAARRIAGGEAEIVQVEADDVSDLLGRPRIRPEQVAGEDQIGVATGMYYTPAGGDIMFVEAATMAGGGKLVLTGQLGDVMKESAQAAWSFARAHGRALGVDASESDRDIHIHVPAGAVKKDGPSAGITMATALVSCFSDRKVRRDLAMTGELTLTGRVLPIGGVKEKVLGAVRAGITEIILPAENEADLDDLPVDVQAELTVHAVRELGEVLELALIEPAAEPEVEATPAVKDLESEIHH